MCTLFLDVFHSVYFDLCQMICSYHFNMGTILGLYMPWCLPYIILNHDVVYHYGDYFGVIYAVMPAIYYIEPWWSVSLWGLFWGYICCDACHILYWTMMKCIIMGTILGLYMLWCLPYIILNHDVMYHYGDYFGVIYAVMPAIYYIEPWWSVSLWGLFWGYICCDACHILYWTMM